MLKAEERLVFALDVRELTDAIELLDTLEGTIRWVKVNSIAAAYSSILGEIEARNMKIWRDWKHHDIPGTVYNFIAADIISGVDMTTIHTLGGRDMMEYAVKAKREMASNIKILGITILTSHDQKSFNEDLGIPGKIEDKVLWLSQLAKIYGLDGVVCSAKELGVLRNIEGLLKVTPGIKPEWAVKREDQVRIATPHKAIKDGADMIVVGSAIYKAVKPVEAAEKIIAEIEEEIERR